MAHFPRWEYDRYFHILCSNARRWSVQRKPCYKYGIVTFNSAINQSFCICQQNDVVTIMQKIWIACIIGTLSSWSLCFASFSSHSLHVSSGSVHLLQHCCCTGITNQCLICIQCNLSASFLHMMARKVCIMWYISLLYNCTTHIRIMGSFCHFHNRNLHTWKDDLHIETWLWLCTISNSARYFLLLYHHNLPYFLIFRYWNSSAPLYYHGSTLILAWIRNHMTS